MGRTALLLSALVGGVVAGFWPSRPNEFAKGPLPNAVYVWQRSWSEEVRSAVSNHSRDFTRFICLAGEIGWRKGHPDYTSVKVHWPSLPTNSGLALRVGTFSGPFRADDSSARFLVSTCRRIVEEARSNGLSPSELQIDFDCADAKLVGYATWLKAVRKEIAPLPLTITSLPSWLNESAFRQLLAQVDGYVLQVHAVKLPRGNDSSLSLCDPGLARAAVLRAADFDKPFWVALPTYGSSLLFDEANRFVKIRAEGPPITTSDKKMTTRHVRADPEQMAALVKEWHGSRPAALEGIIWYRLPVSTDEFNWPWRTLEQVMGGKAPEPRVHLEHRATADGLIEIDIVNHGSADGALPRQISVSWTNAQSLASDALNGYGRVAAAPGRFELHNHSASAIRPAERLTIAWMRLTEMADISLEVLP